MSRISGKHQQLSLKILSLILAIVLWVYVSDEINPSAEQVVNRVPVEVRGLASGKILLAGPGTVDVRVQGARQKVQQVGARAVTAYIDLSKVGNGLHRVPVRVKVPEGLTVVDVSPKEIEVRIEKVAEKEVPVVLEKNGKTARGYRMLEPVFDPARVILKGPQSILDKIKKAVVKVSFNNTTDGFHGNMPVQVVDEKGSLLDINQVKIFPEKVDVFVPVVLDLPNKVVPVRPVIVGQPATGYIVSNIVPELANISIFGPRESVRLVKEVVTAAIDISGANGDVYKEVALKIPGGTNAGVTSIRVLVKIVPQPAPTPEPDATPPAAPPNQ